MLLGGRYVSRYRTYCFASLFVCSFGLTCIICMCIYGHIFGVQTTRNKVLSQTKVFFFFFTAFRYIIEYVIMF